MLKIFGNLIMGERGCFSHIVGGAIKGIFIGGIAGAVAGVALRHNSQGIITMASQGAQVLGPTNWPTKYEECGGLQQSPINIQTSKLKKRRTKKPLKWVNYSESPNAMRVENSGHSIHTNGTWSDRDEHPYITNGPLEKKYYFSQLHFHWGKDSKRGSEHLVNKKSFPLEMHVVHDRSMGDSSGLPTEAVNDELVVVTFMFQITVDDNPSLAPILKGAKKVQGSEKKLAEIQPFSLDELIDTFTSDYVCYKGSLTTPPCIEGVIWIINSKPLGISERQLTILRRSVRNKYGDIIANNRPVQDLNGRYVYYVYC